MKQLFEEAKKAQQQSYSPYSNFPVGAVVEGEDGTLYAGSNIENASYSLTNCAERTAIFHAITQGARGFRRLAVIGPNEEPIAPCGACRQVLAEFCRPDMPILMFNQQGEVTETTVEKLLPAAFSKEDVYGL